MELGQKKVKMKNPKFPSTHTKTFLNTNFGNANANLEPLELLLEDLLSSKSLASIHLNARVGRNIEIKKP